MAIRDYLGILKQVGAWLYLGISITGLRLRRTKCSDVEHSIREYLKGWQNRSLSMMYRVILVRLVLNLMPIYLLVNTILPKSSLQMLELLFRNFLWGSSSDRDGVHLIAWGIICQPICDDGLDIQSLLVKSEAVIVKHVARFLFEPEGFWCSMMRAKYGVWVVGMEF